MVRIWTKRKYLVFFYQIGPKIGYYNIHAKSDNSNYWPVMLKAGKSPQHSWTLRSLNHFPSIHEVTKFEPSSWWHFCCQPDPLTHSVTWSLTFWIWCKISFTDAGNTILFSPRLEDKYFSISPSDASLRTFFFFATFSVFSLFTLIAAGFVACDTLASDVLSKRL